MPQCKNIILISLFLAFAAYGQQLQRIAILGTEDDGEPPIKILEQTHLTDKLREIASNILPSSRYGVMTQQSIVDRLGSQEQAVKICREATCLADLGRKVNADYIAQARIGRFGGNLTIKVELYNVGSGNLIASFTGDSKNVQGLLKILEAKAPVLFKKMLDNDVGEGFFTDSRDGKKYRMVKIGGSVWMAENLNYNANGSKCYDNLESNCKKYGRLYNWNTAVKACPSGWHLSSKAEWDELVEVAGGEKVASKHLKAKIGWNGYKGKNGNGQDSYGFSAIPAGFGFSGEDFGSVGYFGGWWSSTEDGSDYAYNRGMYYNNSESVDWGSYGKDVLFSVRCVKD